MSFNGYNVEDSILFNEASVKRGMFRITYYNMYEAREESSSVRGTQRDTRFANIQKEGAIGIKPGYDYSYLDDNGLIRENTEMDDKKVVIGLGSISIQNEGGQMRDASTMPKKGQLGFVDKAFMTEGDTGFRLAKVRIREERFPSIGDKFCSRCGQKGTCGLIIPEKDMPFTKDGIRPDIIINPHAIPTRMTIGQLIESLMGKACVLHGGFGNCTAFTNNGTKHQSFGSVLTNYGFHSSGTEVMYNGMTGEQVKSDIYIGPTYYMRLKQMVKDKINYRSQGPRTQLTRQTVQGRANDGGLRVGEMERDGILGHGAAHFLNESLMVRGDEYYMAVCNKSGMIAIYNPNQKLFMSPMVDGPIQYSGNLAESGAGSVIQMTKFGRSFSIVRIPYCLKLLMQELLVMNVQMRIITDDNIDQLPSMSYSNNIYKVLKDGRGSMGVDDIIEKNRLAAGLKPSVRRGDGDGDGDEGYDESSRIYLPSRSDVPAFGEQLPTRVATFTPDDPAYMAAIDKLTFDVDVDTKEQIKSFGWQFAIKPEIIKQLKASTSMGNGESDPYAISSFDDLNSGDLVMESVILDKNGEPSERWTISGAQWIGDYPTRFPDDWLSGMLVYTDDTPISPSDMVEELRKIRKPLNWVRAIISLIEKRINKSTSFDESNKAVNLIIDNDKLIAENAKEVKRVTLEIERSKREGKVAEEEQFKVQLTRLTDERTKLDAVRRDIEASIELENEERSKLQGAAEKYTTSSPRYSAMYSDSVFSPVNKDDKLREAVSTFNAKMVEKFSDDVPRTDSEDNTPRTPEYSSVISPKTRLEQQGGHMSKTQQFIPQIPLSLLENHLNSRQGASFQTGGGYGGGNNFNPQYNFQHQQQLQQQPPMMNVPVVATMPMTAMAMTPSLGQMMTANTPQTGGGAVAVAGAGPQPGTSAASATPNQQGVKTLSIKI
jgi:hypothetical protein